MRSSDAWTESRPPAEAAAVDVSAIVVSHNTRSHLERCLTGLAGTVDETIVVDNGSTDGSAELVRQAFPSVKLIALRENRGFGAASNEGMQAARGRYFLLVNSDAWPVGDAVRRLVRFADERPRSGAIGPRLIAPDASVQPSVRGFPTLWRLATEYFFLRWLAPRTKALNAFYGAGFDHSNLREAEFVEGAVLLLRREAIGDVGGFDANFFMYNEEVDLCYRLKQAGWSVTFFPGAEFCHIGRASTQAVWPRMYREQLRSHLRFLAKHRGMRRAERGRMLLLVAQRLRALVFWLLRDRERAHLSQDAAHWLGSADVGSLLDEPRTMRPFLAPPPSRPVEPGAPPTFSVIIAAYQAADVIGDALASLARQTVAPLEVIVCDDGSTDDIAGAVAPFQSEIHFLRKSHGGEASAKNTAAAAARGDFLLILDADDVYLPGRLEALTELARIRPDLDILTTDGYLVVGERRLRRNYDRSWPFEVRDQRRAILQRNFVFGLAAVRRERFVEHGGFDESILWTTDWDLWLRLILDGSRVGAVAEPLALYRLRETSLTARRRELAAGKIATLEKARRNPALTASDAPVVARSLAAHRRELAMLDLRRAVADADSTTRRRALDVLRGPGFSLRSRVTAAGALAAPRVCGGLLRRRAASSWVGAGGTRVSRGTAAGVRSRISRWVGARGG